MTFHKDGAEFYGEMAEILGSISQKDWAFFEYRSNIMGQIFRVMKRNNIKKSDVAKMLGKSRSFVTQVFSAEHNITMKTFCDILYVLDAKAETRIVEKNDEVMWEVHVVDRSRFEFSTAKKQIMNAYANFEKNKFLDSGVGFLNSKDDCAADEVAYNA